MGDTRLHIIIFSIAFVLIITYFFNNYCLTAIFRMRKIFFLIFIDTLSTVYMLQ